MKKATLEDPLYTRMSSIPTPLEHAAYTKCENPKQVFSFIKKQVLLEYVLASRVKNIFCDGVKVLISSRVKPNHQSEFFGWDPDYGKWYFINYPKNINPTLALNQWAIGYNWRPFIGDFNGDGKEDVTVWSPDNGSWQVALNNGVNLVPTNGPNGYNWLSYWAISSNWVPFIGDFNGDGKDDILAWWPNTGRWQVALSDGQSFIPNTGANGNYNWLNSWAVGKHYIPIIGDFNCDGLDDILVYNAICNCWDLAISLGDRFEPIDHIYPGNWIAGYSCESLPECFNSNS